MNKRIAFWMVLAASLAMGSLAPGCPKKDQADRPGQAKKYRVALIMKSLANEFFKTMEEGAVAHQKEHASEYELIAQGIKDEQDVTTQTNLVEQMIGRVDAIVIAPADSKALVPVCKRAMDEGIVVVNIDNKFDEQVLAERKASIPFVGPNNRTGARLAGEYLAKKLKPGDKVAIVEGLPNAFNGVQRKLGFEDAMGAAGIKVETSQTANWERDQAERVVSGIITQCPDLKALLCANDSMALGAVSALKSAGRNDVLVVGYDNIAAVQARMKEGRVLCTVDQHADKIAVFGIQCALDILKTKAAPGHRETSVDLITAESLK